MKWAAGRRGPQTRQTRQRFATNLERVFGKAVIDDVRVGDDGVVSGDDGERMFHSLDVGANRHEAQKDRSQDGQEKFGFHSTFDGTQRAMLQQGCRLILICRLINSTGRESSASE